MSDLAPFVAAAIRDKVVQDLDDEIRELREFYQRVSLAHCTEKMVVFAQGNLWEAGRHHHPLYSNELVLKVRLSQQSPCPLRDLGKLQILVGGYHRESFAGMWTHLKLSCDQIAIGYRTPSVCVTFRIEGWPSSHRKTWIGQNNRTFREGRARELLDEIPRLFPQATVSFDYIFLTWKREKHMIERFPEPDRTRLKELFELNMGYEMDNEEPNQQGLALSEALTTTTRRGVLPRFFKFVLKCKNKYTRRSSREANTA